MSAPIPSPIPWVSTCSNTIITKHISNQYSLIKSSFSGSVQYMCNDYTLSVCHSYLGEGKYDLFCNYLKYVITTIVIFSPLQPLGMKNIKFSTFYRSNAISIDKDKSHYRGQKRRKKRKYVIHWKAYKFSSMPCNSLNYKLLRAPGLTQKLKST